MNCTVKWNNPILKLRANDETKLACELKTDVMLPDFLRLIDDDSDVISNASPASLRAGCSVEYQGVKYKFEVSNQVGSNNQFC